MRSRPWVVLGVVFVLTFAGGVLLVRDAVTRTVEQQALAVAEIVAQQAVVARSVYNKEVVAKLARDGLGADAHSDQRLGHVPIPAQFLKLVGRASSERADKLYEYRPVSKWNLEPSQGLSDDFLRWAWPQLESQEAAQPPGVRQWTPVSRFEEHNGQRVLRLLVADPASQMGCVACHNRYEQQPDIQRQRVAAGVTPGKQWTLHELMGALSVTIPLDRAEALAGTQVGKTSLFIFAILGGSFVAVFWYNLRLTRQERSLHETEAQLARSELVARTARDLLEAKEGVEQAFAELSTYMQAIDQHAIVSVAERDGRIVQVNDRLVEVSGFTREELLGQDHRLLNSGTHDKGFFTQMWKTLASGQVWRGVICNRTKGGDLYWVDSAIVPLKDGRGEIVRYVSIRIDITERKRAEQEMLRLATTDGLTGLANRGLLRDRMQQALAHDRRMGEHAALLFIDLDHFKAVNDSFGHDMGDRLLVEVAHRLRGCVRSEDTVARQGGDEFIVFLPSISKPDDAGVLAEKLQRVLSLPVVIDGRELYVGGSIGVAVFPEDGADVDALLKRSDAAMYQAKEGGRGRVAYASSSLDQSAFERYTLGAELRRAADRGELRLVYQPIVNLADGRMTAMEALLRWQHPQRGAVSPADFIPLAEATGQIVALGDWVILHACQQIRRWLDAGLDVPRVAINLSALQVQQGSLITRLQDILDETGVRGDGLEFEITEGCLMRQTEDVQRTLLELQAMGAHLAIDDFGTGYSSLAYLKRLPIHTLKIDRSFVVDIGVDADDTAIVETVVALGHNLHLRVVAEGVETPLQRDFLATLGCDHGQGYLFSRPLEEAAMTEHLRQAASPDGAHVT
ncbi:MAG TPA: EAL domain-containing protein [Burkholderiaceae bacterium]|nr:EAL domain-containing protein [Burkholderiaceae bacterium]